MIALGSPNGSLLFFKRRGGGDGGGGGFAYSCSLQNVEYFSHFSI